MSPPSQAATTNAPPRVRPRGIERLLRNADLIAAGAIACLFTAHFWGTADPFTGSGTDIISLETPLHALAGKWLSIGVLPLWNPYIFGGIPFQAGVHGLLYPGFLGAAFLDVFWDIKIFITLHLMLAAVGGAWFARTDCRSPISRVLLGTVTAVSAFSVLHLFAGHRVLVACAAYLPWVAGAARRILRGDRAAVVYGVVLAGLMMLLGHYQIIFIAGWGLLLWIVLDRMLNRERPGTLSATRAAGEAAATVVGLFAAGALIAAVQILPAAFLAGESQRPGDNAAFAASFSASPSSLLCYLLPDAFGNKIETPFVGDFAFWESIGYLGIVPPVPPCDRPGGAAYQTGDSGNRRHCPRACR